MKLLVDVGNSCLKWTTAAPGELRHHSFLYKNQSVDDLLEQHWKSLSAPSTVVIASVANQAVNESLETWIGNTWGVMPKFLTAEAACLGVHNGYQEPHRLGIDRWLALIAAHVDYGGLSCVIDCGTAVTIDVITADGHHQGGLIIPGLATMRESLLHNTAQVHLSSEQLQEGAQCLGKNTTQGVMGGCLYTLIAAIERVVGDLKKEFGAHLSVILTGGDASTLLPLLTIPVVDAPTLVLQGMRAVTEEAQASKSKPTKSHHHPHQKPKTNAPRRVRSKSQNHRP